MNKKHLYAVAVLLILTGIAACKKDHDSTPITPANLAGTYGLKSLVWTYGGQDYHVYDSLDPCEKDNLIQLNVDMSAKWIDAGIVCDPAENEDDTWYLSNDSLLFHSSIEGGKIKSFDGKTLVMTGEPEPGIVGTTTLVKQ
jgi:hypothetical protein